MPAPQENSGSNASKYRIFENFGDCVLILSSTWRIVYANSAARAQLEPAGTLEGAAFGLLFPNTVGGVLTSACRKVMRDRVPVRCEAEFLGRAAWAAYSVNPCEDAVALTIREIAPPGSGQHLLRESEERARQQLEELEAIYLSAPIGLTVMSPDLTFLRVNEKMARIHGIPVAAHIGRTLRDIRPDIADIVEPVYRTVVETGEPCFGVEAAGHSPGRADGPRSWIGNLMPLKDAAGKVVAINVSVKDVTPLKQAQAALQETVDELATIVHAVPAAVFIGHDPECRDMTGNQACLEMLRLPQGANPSKTAPNPPTHFRPMKNGVEIAPADLPVQKAAATGKDVRGFELDLLFDDQTIMSIYGSARPLFDAHGKPRGAVGAFIDVTEIVTASGVQPTGRAGTLRAGTGFFRPYRRFPVPVHSIGPDGKLAAVNDAWLSFTGYTEEEVVGRSLAEFLDPESAKLYRESAVPELIAEVPARQTRSVQYRLVKRSGESADIIITAQPERDPSTQHFLHSLAVTIDVADQTRAETAFRQARNLQAIGSLTSGIAHDFRNLLMVILSNLRKLERQLPADDARTAHLLGGALKAATRGTTLTSRLLDYARQQELAPVEVDARKLIEDLATTLPQLLGPSIDVDAHAPAGLWNPHADLEQLELTLLNFATNARDAMPDGGLLQLTARNETIAESQLHAALPDLPHGHYVVLCVSDTGLGMDKATLDRATQPFFTTKGPRAGTGLGLSMATTFAEQSGGALMLSSEPGRGTKVELWLPRTPPKAMPLETAFK